MIIHIKVYTRWQHHTYFKAWIITSTGVRAWLEKCTCNIYAQCRLGSCWCAFPKCGKMYYATAWTDIHVVLPVSGALVRMFSWLDTNRDTKIWASAVHVFNKYTRLGNMEHTVQGTNYVLCIPEWHIVDRPSGGWRLRSIHDCQPLWRWRWGSADGLKTGYLPSAQSGVSQEGHGYRSRVGKHVQCPSLHFLQIKISPSIHVALGTLVTLHFFFY